MKNCIFNQSYRHVVIQLLVVYQNQPNKNSAEHFKTIFKPLFLTKFKVMGVVFEYFTLVQNRPKTGSLKTPNFIM